jgi:hypothetical protein
MSPLLLIFVGAIALLAFGSEGKNPPPPSPPTPPPPSPPPAPTSRKSLPVVYEDECGLGDIKDAGLRKTAATVLAMSEAQAIVYFSWNATTSPGVKPTTPKEALLGAIDQLNAVGARRAAQCMSKRFGGLFR